MPSVGKDIQTESRGWAEGIGGYCLLGTEFRFGMMKIFWRQVVEIVHIVNVLNVMLLNLHLKMVKMVTLCDLFYSS